LAEYGKPLPQATPETQQYWDGLKEHKLMIQRCLDCDKPYFYPRVFCPNCFSKNVEWFQATGKGTLYSFVINQRPAPGFQDDGPYVLAVVQLDEGPRMFSNLIGIDPDPEQISCDMPVEIEYDDVTEEVTLPKFRPA
jgi:uncharacterized OB-fold protein